MWAIFSILLLFCFNINSQSLYFIHDTKNDEYYCVTNSSYGLTRIEENQSAGKSVFVPSSEDRSFEWVFKNESRNKFSGSSKTVYATILDRRWEELEPNRTSRFHTSPNYRVENNFLFPFSVKAEGDVDLYLCGCMKRPCYVLRLSNLSAHRCETDNLKKCRYLKTGPWNMNQLLSKSCWRHFELLKVDTKITLQVLNGTSRTIVLEFEDKEAIQSKLIHTITENISYWKFHISRPDFYITEEIKDRRFGPTIRSGFFCVNFFAMMCANCRLKVTLAEAQTRVTIQEHYFSQMTTWKEIKIVNKNIRSDVVVLVSTTSKSGRNEGNFWVIDKVRTCQENEFRYLSSKSSQDCQLVVDDKTTIIRENQMVLSSHNIPCFWNSSCDAAKIYKGRKKTAAATCPDTDCLAGFYDDCCIPKCDGSENGTCFSRKSLRKQQNLIMTKPVIRSVGQTKVVISLDQEFSNESVLLHCIQYKEKERAQWMQSCPPEGTNNMSIQNLKPDCDYVVRSVIVTSSGAKFEDQLPVVPFRTEAVRKLNLNVVFFALFILVLLLLLVSFSARWISVYRKRYKTLRDSDYKTNYRQSIPLEKSHVVPVVTFEQYVKACLDNDVLEQQHKSILKEAKILDQNTSFHVNFKHVGTKLSSSSALESYIITEMPTSSQFWKMIWKEKVDNIIVLDDKQTTDPPNMSETTKYHNITVKFNSCQPFSHYERRIYMLCCGKKRRYVTQLRFTVNKETFAMVPILRTISQITTNSPIVVYSRSSKFQTSGFVVLCAATLRSALQYDYVDFLQTAATLVELRTELCRDTQLYILAHVVVLESLWNFDTQLELSTMTPENMRQYFKNFQKVLWLDQMTKQKDLSKPQVNKHEYAKIDKITPIVVDGYHSSEKFYVARKPTKYNLNHFWEMVAEEQITKIVDLEGPSENKLELPTEAAPVLKTSESATITFITKMNLKNYIWTSVKLSNGNENLTLDVFSVKSDFRWNISDFTNFCVESKIILRGSKSTLVTCSDGLTASGLFLATLYNMKLAQEEGSCDISRSVRVLRSYHSSFVKNEEQFIILWNVVKCYLEETNLYQR